LFARYNLIDSMHESTIERIELSTSGTEPQQFPFPAQRSEAFAAIGTAQSENVEASSKGLREPNSIVYFLNSKSGKPLDWATRWQNTGLLKFEDLNQDGQINLTLMPQDDGTKRSELAKIDRDIIVLSTPEVAALPPWVIALVAAGGLAAALSTAAGLLLVISSSLAHDLYIRFFEPNATEARKLFIGRVAIIFGIFVAGYFGIYPPGFVGEVVAFAFGLAAASFFPAIFLGIFSKRVNRAGAVTGMIVGLLFTSTYIVLCTADKVLPFLFDAPILAKENWLFGISPQGIGTIGMVINFVLTLIISSMTPPPPAEVIELIESVRIPAGSGTAVDH